MAFTGRIANGVAGLPLYQVDKIRFEIKMENFLFSVFYCCLHRIYSYRYRQIPVEVYIFANDELK